VPGSSLLRLSCSACVVILLLVTAAFAHPASGVGSPGQFEVTSQSYLGYAQFTVSYNTSDSAAVGTNLTVSAMVSVDNLTGSELYVRDYVLLVMFLCDNHSTSSSLGSPEPTQSYLYQGARWGPLNFSIPLTAEDTGLSPGQSDNASITLRLITDVSYDAPGYRLSGYSPVFGDGSAFVLVQDPGGPQAPTEGAAGHGIPLVPSLLVGGGVAVLVVRMTVFRKRREEKT
jgi:hypothetical protein